LRVHQNQSDFHSGTEYKAVTSKGIVEIKVDPQPYKFRKIKFTYITFFSKYKVYVCTSMEIHTPNRKDSIQVVV